MTVQFLTAVDCRPSPRIRGGKNYYLPEWYRKLKDEIGTAAKVAMRTKKPCAGGISMQIICWRKYQTTSRNYGDIDNIAKTVIDSLNGICYNDDAQIVSLKVQLLRGEPRLYVKLREEQKP